MNRRSVLVGVAGTFAGLTGCLGSGPTTRRPTATAEGTSSNGSTPINEDTATSTNTAADEAPPLVEEVTLHTGDGRCGSDATAAVTTTNDGIQATGTIVAPTPCHTVQLLGFDDTGPDVRFRIGVEQPQDTATCVQCLGEIQFKLTAVFRGSFDEAILHLNGTEPTTIRKQL